MSGDRAVIPDAKKTSEQIIRERLNEYSDLADIMGRFVVEHKIVVAEGIRQEEAIELLLKRIKKIQLGASVKPEVYALKLQLEKILGKDLPLDSLAQDIFDSRLVEVEIRRLTQPNGILGGEDTAQLRAILFGHSALPVVINLDSPFAKKILQLSAKVTGANSAAIEQELSTLLARLQGSSNKNDPPRKYLGDKPILSAVLDELEIKPTDSIVNALFAENQMRRLARKIDAEWPIESRYYPADCIKKFTEASDITAANRVVDEVIDAHIKPMQENYEKQIRLLEKNLEEKDDLSVATDEETARKEINKILASFKKDRPLPERIKQEQLLLWFQSELRAAKAVTIAALGKLFDDFPFVLKRLLFKNHNLLASFKHTVSMTLKDKSDTQLINSILLARVFHEEKGHSRQAYFRRFSDEIKALGEGSAARIKYEDDIVNFNLSLLPLKRVIYKHIHQELVASSSLVSEHKIDLSQRDVLQSGLDILQKQWKMLADFLQFNGHTLSLMSSLSPAIEPGKIYIERVSDKTDGSLKYTVLDADTGEILSGELSVSSLTGLSRLAGSGPLTDADLDKAKQLLPSILNVMVEQGKISTREEMQGFKPLFDPLSFLLANDRSPLPSFVMQQHLIYMINCYPATVANLLEKNSNWLQRVAIGDSSTVQVQRGKEFFIRSLEEIEKNGKKEEKKEDEKPLLDNTRLSVTTASAAHILQLQQSFALALISPEHKFPLSNQERALAAKALLEVICHVPAKRDHVYGLDQHAKLIREYLDELQPYIDTELGGTLAARQAGLTAASSPDVTIAERDAAQQKVAEAEKQIEEWQAFCAYIKGSGSVSAPSFHGKSILPLIQKGAQFVNEMEKRRSEEKEERLRVEMAARKVAEDARKAAIALAAAKAREEKMAADVAKATEEAIRAAEIKKAEMAKEKKMAEAKAAAGTILLSKAPPKPDTTIKKLHRVDLLKGKAVDSKAAGKKAAPVIEEEKLKRIRERKEADRRATERANEVRRETERRLRIQQEEIRAMTHAAERKYVAEQRKRELEEQKRLEGDRDLISKKALEAFVKVMAKATTAAEYSQTTREQLRGRLFSHLTSESKDREHLAKLVGEVKKNIECLGAKNQTEVMLPRNVRREIRPYDSANLFRTLRDVPKILTAETKTHRSRFLQETDIAINYIEPESKAAKAACYTERVTRGQGFEVRVLQLPAEVDRELILEQVLREAKIPETLLRTVVSRYQQTPNQAPKDFLEQQAELKKYNHEQILKNIEIRIYEASAREIEEKGKKFDLPTEPYLKLAASITTSFARELGHSTTLYIQENADQFLIAALVVMCQAKNIPYENKSKFNWVPASEAVDFVREQLIKGKLEKTVEISIKEELAELRELSGSLRSEGAQQELVRAIDLVEQSITPDGIITDKISEHIQEFSRLTPPV